MDAMVKVEMWRKKDAIVVIDCVSFEEAMNTVHFKLSNLHFRYAQITSLEHADLSICYYVMVDRYAVSHIGEDETMIGAIETARAMVKLAEGAYYERVQREQNSI